MHNIRHMFSVSASGVAVAVLAVILQTAPALALTSDQSALVQIVNQYVTKAPGSSQAYVSGMSIYAT